jgi:uncharacterized protein YndB with AHSA1/START domain
VDLRESILIPAPADRVWAAVANPETWLAWNPKIKSVRRANRGSVVAGEHFHAVFMLGKRELASNVEIVACEPPTRLELRQHYEFRQRSRFIRVVFDLESTAAGVRLTQTMDVAGAGIPWPLRLLVGWIHRFGRPVGKSSLEQLRTQLTAPNPAEAQPD